jgi:hypothetical protein
MNLAHKRSLKLSTVECGEPLESGQDVTYYLLSPETQNRNTYMI